MEGPRLSDAQSIPDGKPSAREKHWMPGHWQRARNRQGKYCVVCTAYDIEAAHYPMNWSNSNLFTSLAPTNLPIRDKQTWISLGKVLHSLIKGHSNHSLHCKGCGYGSLVITLHFTHMGLPMTGYRCFQWDYLLFYIWEIDPEEVN